MEIGTNNRDRRPSPAVRWGVFSSGAVHAVRYAIAGAKAGATAFAVFGPKGAILGGLLGAGTWAAGGLLKGGLKGALGGWVADTFSPMLERWLTPQKMQFRCPLILDFNRDGNLGLNKAAFFDLTANGFHELTAWFDETNAFLVLDKHGTGLIENGSQMFGHAMVLPNGMTALSGWDALRFFDSNGNGKIDVNDEIFSSLGVLTGDGRFYSLADAGIVSITLPLTASVRGQKNSCLSFCGASRWSEISPAWLWSRGFA